MENLANYYPMIAECLVNVVRVVIAVVFGVIVIPWVKKNAIPWLKENQLYGIICRFVRAAEKLGDTGFIEKEEKLDYVIDLLKAKGIKITDEIRALIESAVGDLDDEFAYNMLSVVDALTSAEAIADMSVDEEDFDAEDTEEDEAPAEE